MSTLKVNNITDLGNDPVLTDGVLDVTTPAILQVVSTTKADIFSISLASLAEAEITGLNCTITPSSISSKILISYTISAGAGQTTFAPPAWKIYRDTTAVGLGDARDSRVQVTSGSSSGATRVQNMAFTSDYMDSPASTSAITYSVKIKNVNTSTDTYFVNRSEFDNDPNYSTSYTLLPISTLTVMEVAG